MTGVSNVTWRNVCVAAVLATGLLLAGCSESPTPDGPETAPPTPADAPDTRPADAPTTQPASEGESASLAPYPLDVCIVSGEPLDSMGGEVVIAYEGREIKFCCEGCDEMFLSNPARYLPKLAAADVTE